MRLINAEDLSKVLQDYFKDLIERKKYMVDTVDCNADIQRLLSEQPTAYNLDAVVEQLEEYAKSDVCYRHDGCPYRNNPEIKCENCGALGTLDIVRNSGKE